MRTIAALLGLLMVAMSATAQAPRSNEPIPYIYYFSLEEQALVIERADGTDKHLIAQGIVPTEYSLMEDIRWSASGEWVA